MIYVDIDSPNPGFPYLNFLGGAPVTKKHPVQDPQATFKDFHSSHSQCHNDRSKSNPNNQTAFKLNKLNKTWQYIQARSKKPVLQWNRTLHFTLRYMSESIMTIFEASILVVDCPAGNICISYFDFCDNICLDPDNREL